MTKIALFPGSFDPITLGHVDIIHRSKNLFDKIIIAIGQNSQKQNLFPAAVRKQWLQEIFAADKNIEIAEYEGLTVEFCKQKQANYILRGLRNSSDFEYEKSIAAINTSMEPGIETVFIITSPEYSHISSTLVRELIKYKGKFSHLVPACVTRDA